jgi:hypothetical protein
VYRTLARTYGFGPDVTRRMTPYQQMMYLNDDMSDPTTETLTFKSIRELEEWRSRHA